MLRMVFKLKAFRLAPAQWALTCLAILVLPVLSASAQSEPSPQTTQSSNIYLIGNSLTWDTLPGLLDGNVMWHVDCGKNLKYIAEHPAKPCVKTSVPWTEALKSQKFDTLCVQPFIGTTLEEDVELISRWLDMQPFTTLVIHTGWYPHRELQAATAETSPAETNGPSARSTHTPEYFVSLQQMLSAKYPELQIRSTGAMDTLEEISADIEKQAAPLTSISQLYRDDIHMKTQSGRFLMHNLMRAALGQKVSEQGFQVDEPLRSYLRGKIRMAKQRR